MGGKIDKGKTRMEQWTQITMGGEITVDYKEKHLPHNQSKQMGSLQSG